MNSTFDDLKKEIDELNKKNIQLERDKENLLNRLKEYEIYSIEDAHKRILFLMDELKKLKEREKKLTDKLDKMLEYIR